MVALDRRMSLLTEINKVTHPLFAFPDRSNR